MNFLGKKNGGQGVYRGLESRYMEIIQNVPETHKNTPLVISNYRNCFCRGIIFPAPVMVGSTFFHDVRKITAFAIIWIPTTF